MILFIAGLLEVVWAASMKASDGFTRWPWTLLRLAAGILGIKFLGSGDES